MVSEELGGRITEEFCSALPSSSYKVLLRGKTCSPASAGPRRSRGSRSTRLSAPAVVHHAGPSRRLYDGVSLTGTGFPGSRKGP